MQDLEKQVAVAPSDHDLRWRLLRASFPATSPEARASRLNTLLWVIGNTPEAEIAGSPYARVNHLTEPAAYEQAKALWLSILDGDPANLKVLLNVARFFATDEPKLSEELFTKGMQLDPENPEWRTRLGMLLHEPAL